MATIDPNNVSGYDRVVRPRPAFRPEAEHLAEFAIDLADSLERSGIECPTTFTLKDLAVVSITKPNYSQRKVEITFTRP